MKIGPYEIYPVETGTFWLDGGAMFGVIPKVLWEKTNKPDNRNRVKLTARSLLIIGKGKKILMDNGNGTMVTDKFIDIYGVDNRGQTLYGSLAQHGVMAENITDVIISHLHFDHAGGSTIIENGVLKPAFQHARYHVQKAQWDNAINPTERDRASYMPESYLPLKKYGVVELADGEYEIFPGIHILPSNGHTPGLQMLKITDGENTLFYPADLTPFTSHIPLPYIMSFDLMPLITLEDKKKYLGQAADEDWVLFFEHDPVTIAGKVARTEKGFKFGGPVEFV